MNCRWVYVCMCVGLWLCMCDCASVICQCDSQVCGFLHGRTRVQQRQHSIVWYYCLKQTATLFMPWSNKLKLYRVEWSHMTYANTIYGHKQKHALLGNLTIVPMAFLTMPPPNIHCKFAQRWGHNSLISPVENKRLVVSDHPQAGLPDGPIWKQVWYSPGPSLSLSPIWSSHQLPQ